jgi:hypothetical protein
MCREKLKAFSTFSITKIGDNQGHPEVKTILLPDAVTCP